MIKDGRYRAGWTRLSAGRRKRRAAALVARTRMESRGRGVSSEVAGDGDGNGRRPDDRLVDATPPCRVLEGAGGLFFRPPSIVADPWTVMARTIGISGRVIGISSR